MLITQTSGNVANGLASGLFAAINNTPASNKTPKKVELEAAQGNDIATEITLSPEAQQRLDSDKAAAEKLAVANNNTNAEDTGKDLSFESLFDMAMQNIPNRKSESVDGVLKALPEEQMRATMQEASLKLWIGNVERKNPVEAAAFKEAMANGTARIRLAADVPGANARTSVIYFEDGKGMQTSQSGTNSREIQDMLDAGKALMTWKHGVGDLFITW